MSDMELVLTKSGEIERLCKRFGYGGKGLIGNLRKTDLSTPVIKVAESVAAIRDKCVHGQFKAFRSETDRDRFVQQAQLVRDELVSLDSLLRLQPVSFSLLNKEYDAAFDCWQSEENHWQVHCWREFHRGINQRWLLSNVDDAVVIRSSEANHCLDAFEQDGAWKVHLWNYHGGANQKWKLTRLEDHSHRIVSCANPAMSLDAWETGGEIIVHLWETHQGDNQKWWINPVF